MNKHEVAALLGVSDRTVDDWVQRGRLKSFKAGRLNRFTMRHVEDFLRETRDGQLHKVRRGTLSDAKPSSTTGDART